MAITCNYPENYVLNLEYVSRGLLSIINGNILPAIPANYVPTTDCTTRVGSFTPFNCTTWNTIKNLLIGPCDDSTGFLDILCRTLACIVSNVTFPNYGIKAQFERFSCLCKAISSKLAVLICDDNNFRCAENVGDLLCLLIQLLTKLISVITKAASLVLYSNCVLFSDCPATVVTFYDCMVCDFVNDLCDLEKLDVELNALVMAFLACTMANCTPCGTAPCAPVKTRPQCPPQMKYGKSCGCNKCDCQQKKDGGCCHKG